MYTLETLKAANRLYDARHRLEQRDVDVTNRHIEVIQRSRTDNGIQVGDIAELTTREGDYYANAHIDKYDEDTDTWYVCERGMPFVFVHEQHISCLTSGGAWRYVPNNLAFAGKRLKRFWYFGSCGACAEGGIYFDAEVNVWEYKEPGPLYGAYTTKDWQKHYITDCADKNGTLQDGISFRYYSNGLSFADKPDYDAWLKTFRSVVFEGNNPNHSVVFRYRERAHLIDKDKWERLVLPLDTRLCNGVILCKVDYDDETHFVDVYRFTNVGEPERKDFKPYQLARGKY